MKTSILTLLTAILLLAANNQAFAKVWRLNNIPGVSADFASFATAQTVAAIGDTIYVEGSHISYGTATVTKRLTIVGSGYFLTVNDSTQAYPGVSQFGSITFSGTSQGSVLTGCQINGPTLVSVDNVSLIRNYFIYNVSSGSTLSISSSRSNILIAQNFIRQSSTSTTNSPYALEIGSNCSNIVVTNNIITKGNITSTSGTAYAIGMDASSAATYTNNVVFGDWLAYNSTLQNNIQGNGSVFRSGTYPNTELNNIGHSTQFGALNGNQQLVNMANVFSYTGSSSEDRYFTLKAGSPAIGAGVSGIDAGAYGGALAYKKSGMPAIPAIFGATVPSSGTTATGINVTIKAKSHK